ncbi:MAG: hypothetical protein LBC84_00130 [Prevotellaceae bacterium]|jgi:hypothetical protein|nr:hypothetical protein [Prevotellaceae bacterium]
MNKKNKNQNLVFLGILFALIVLFIVAPIIFKVFRIEILPSQFFGALIGVFITAIVTAFLLQGQTKGEVQKDKNIKIYEQKIPVFSEFTSKIWKMVSDVESKPEELQKKYEEVKLFCFDKLVFFLEQDETKKLTEIIEKIDITKLIDDNLPHICKITNILQSSLENKHTDDSYLKNLYDAFDRKDTGLEKKTEKEEINNIPIPTEPTRTFWHLIMWNEKQLEVFKREDKWLLEGYWFLTVLDYGDSSKTDIVKHRLKINDVVFLFRRGGYGYIGAFKVTGYMVFDTKKNKKETKIGNSEPVPENYNEKDDNKYDIYGAIADGASYVSNVLVEPLAYNFKGIGYNTVRRRTIERFVNDPNTVNLYLDWFKGNLPEDRKERKVGEGKLDEKDFAPISKENQELFNRLKG